MNAVGVDTYVPSCARIVGPQAAYTTAHLTAVPFRTVLATPSIVTLSGKEALAGGPERSSELCDLLRDPAAFMRHAAARAIGRLGAAAVGTCGEELRAMLHDGDAAVRQAAATAIGRLGEAASAMTPAIAGLLGDADGSVRRAAADALGAMGVAAAEFAGPVAELVGDCEWDVQCAAVRSLEAMGPLAAPAASSVLRAWLVRADVEPTVRRASAEALGNLRGAAAEHASALVTLLADPDSYVRRAAVDALGSVGACSVAPVEQVAARLSDSDAEVRGAAAEALASMGCAALRFSPQIARLLRDDSPDVRLEAAAALEAMSTEPNRLLGLADELLLISDGRLRGLIRPCRAAAARLAKAAVNSLDFWLERLTSTELPFGVKRIVIQSLVGTSAAGHAASVLAELLRDDDATIREPVGETIRRMGRSAKLARLDCCMTEQQDD